MVSSIAEEVLGALDVRIAVGFVADAFGNTLALVADEEVTRLIVEAADRAVRKLGTALGRQGLAVPPRTPELAYFRVDADRSVRGTAAGDKRTAVNRVHVEALVAEAGVLSALRRGRRLAERAPVRAAARREALHLAHVHGGVQVTVAEGLETLVFEADELDTSRLVPPAGGTPHDVVTGVEHRVALIRLIAAEIAERAEPRGLHTLDVGVADLAAARLRREWVALAPAAGRGEHAEERHQNRHQNRASHVVPFPWVTQRAIFERTLSIISY